MSIDWHVYAGPVLVCKFHMDEHVETETQKFYGCTNETCKHHKAKHGLHKDTKFCPACGKPVTRQERTVEKRKNEKSVDCIYDLMSDGGFREDVFDECWGGLNCEKLIASSDVFSMHGDKFDRFLGRKTQFDADEFEIHAENPNIQAEVAKAEEFYAKEIAYLRTKYDSVRVTWMIVVNGR